VELCDTCKATKGGRPFFTRTVNHQQGSRKWKAIIDGTLHSDSEVEEQDSELEEDQEQQVSGPTRGTPLLALGSWMITSSRL